MIGSNKKRINLKVLYILLPMLFALGLSFVWALRLVSDWGTDYGVYYVGANLLSSDYLLYQNHLDHKGPFLYLFLKLLGYIIGWGPIQAFICLGLIVFIFLVTIMALGLRVHKSFIVACFLMLLGSMVLVGQYSNASIAIFQNSLLLWMLFFLIQKNENGCVSVWDFGIAGIFFALAVLTRIDSIVYILIFPVVLWNDSTFNKVKIFLLLFPAFILVSFTGLCAYIMNFSIESFWAWNWVFNIEYNKKFFGGLALNIPTIFHVFYRPLSYSLFMETAIPLCLSVLVMGKNSASIQYRQENIKKNGVLLAVIVISIISYLLTRSDRNYHLLVLAPCIFAFALLIPIESYSKKTAIIILPFIFLSLFYGYVPEIIKSIEAVKNKTMFKMKEDADKKIIKILKENPEIIVMRTRPWYYLFSSAKPLLCLSTHLIFDKRFNYLSNQADFMRKKAQTFIRKSKIKFIVDTETLNYPSPLASDLIKNSRLIFKISKDYELRMATSK